MPQMPKVNFADTEIAFKSRSTVALLKARLVFASFNYPALIKLGTRALEWALGRRLPITPAVRVAFFDLFCGGITIEDSLRTVKELGASGVRSVLDYSVEGAGNEAAFAATVAETLQLIEQARKAELMPFTVFKVTGVGPFELLAKASTTVPLTATEQRAWTKLEGRVHTLCAATAAAGRRLLIDAEETWLQAAIDRLAEQMMREFNRDRAVVYNTFQMYRVDRLAYLKRLHETACDRGFKPGIKLVRGAYMEKERERAAALSLPNPIQPNKAATDADFDAAVAFCIDHIDTMGLFVGTHNEASIRRLTKLMAARGLSPSDERVEVSQLFGMSDNLTYNLAHHGYLTSKYVPYGPVASVLPYLVRRAEENSSVAGQAGRELQLIDQELGRRRGRPLA